MHHLDEFTIIKKQLEEIIQLLSEMNKYRFNDQFIDTDELTQILKISKKTAQLWRDNGLIPYAKLNKKIYYRLSDINALMDKEFQKPKRFKSKEPAKRRAMRHNPNSKGWTINI